MVGRAVAGPVRFRRSAHRRTCHRELPVHPPCPPHPPLADPPVMRTRPDGGPSPNPSRRCGVELLGVRRRSGRQPGHPCASGGPPLGCTICNGGIVKPAAGEPDRLPPPGSHGVPVMPRPDRGLYRRAPDDRGAITDARSRPVGTPARRSPATRRPRAGRRPDRAGGTRGAVIALDAPLVTLDTRLSAAPGHEAHIDVVS